MKPKSSNIMEVFIHLQNRHDLDNNTRQLISNITLEYSISFLEQSKEVCFRRKFPTSGIGISGPMQKIETLLIEDKYLLNNYLVRSCFSSCKNISNLKQMV
jgi:hypothetical protein